MAAGDDAAAAALPTVAQVDLVKDGATEINRTRDIIVNRTTRTSDNLDIWVQATAPAHKVGRIWIKVV